MNWYKHHLGDYDSHTSHLSWDEDLAYTRLLRAYYRRDGPIPESETYRLARAATIGQRNAVDAVLREFFSLVGENWYNKRADEEIASYKSRCEINKLTGIKGGRPAKLSTTESVISRNRFGFPSVSQNNPPQNQIPDGVGFPKMKTGQCAFAGCTKPGTRSRSTNGLGPWYCDQHAEHDSQPTHVLDHLQAAILTSPTTSTTADPPKGKFDD